MNSRRREAGCSAARRIASGYHAVAREVLAEKIAQRDFTTSSRAGFLPSLTYRFGKEGELADMIDLDAYPRPTRTRIGTGQSNLLKYLAGLNRLDSTSVFQLAIAPVPNQIGQVNLAFSPIAEGRTYVVQ